MPYIERNEDNKIIAQFARKQFDEQEFVEFVDEQELYVSIESQIDDVDSQLEELDNKSKRPMRAILTSSEGVDNSEDLALLSKYEAQAIALRNQRAELSEV